MDTQNITTAAIYILGALCVIFVALLQVRQELREMRKNGLDFTNNIVVPEETIRKIAALVIAELLKAEITLQPKDDPKEKGQSPSECRQCRNS